MEIQALRLAIGLLLLLGGGEAVVRGAASVSRKLGVSPLAIGLTVVAFGTSAPELAVNITAAMSDRMNLSFGNIVGSNMANIGLVVGCCGLIRSLPIHSIVVAREIPMMLLATVVTLVLSIDVFSDAPTLDRTDGFILLLFFAVFLYYTIGELIRQRADHPTLDELVGSELPGAGPGVAFARDSLLTLAGFGALLYGADITVHSAEVLARLAGVPEIVIGMGVVAVGTSLPELAAGVMATLRGHMEIAIGNVVGSNIFNLLLVLATTVVIRPMPLPALGLIDLLATGVLSVALLMVSMTARRQIMRIEAGGLLLAYLGYIIWRMSITS